ncbi:hypothetical protein CPB83DRAFT_767307 [Crepidotus variabilis]|uniref:Uncharacterized protein n=1 Tax=Crepidotus variabilis TaxID=179855 RepID=A0A9P6EFG1_9AGAR|nr:hypothetical protein CPB83DRAFT_767307 [Crepidotus variabilis]
MRKFEDAFVRTLRVVCSWLQPSYTSLDDDEDDDDDDDDEEEDDEDEAAEDVDQHKREERDAHENQLLSLFRSSYLLEVLHAFLSNNKPRDWIAHSETYIAILEMMRRMLDSGLGAVLNETPTFSPSGSSASAPASAVYTPFATPSGSTSSSASSSPSSSQQQPPVSLYDLIKQLEKHRSPLMNLASRMQFSATVDKVNNLCDAISYLLLQQMVG